MMRAYISNLFKNEKDRIIIVNIISSFLIKGGALIISFLTMPAYMRFFNNDQVLGVWFTVLSLLTWILSLDFGIGNGLRNKLVGSIVRNDTYEIKTNITSAYFLIGLIVIIGIILGTLLIPNIDWNLFFNIDPKVITKPTMEFVVLIVFITIMIQFQLRLITFILYSLQKAALNNLIALVTSIAQLAFVLFFPSISSEINIKVMAISYLFFVNIPLLITTVWVFTHELRGCSPSIKYFNSKIAVNVVSLGSVFFWNQIMFMIITGSNSIFISRFISPEKVIDYQVYYKLFSVAGMLFTLSLTPLWSAITRAFEEKDHAWINKYFTRMNRLIIILVGAEFLIIPFLQLIIDVWLGSNSFDVIYFNAVVFAIYGSVFLFQTVVSTFACGIGKMKMQLIFYSIGVIVKFLIMIFVIPYYPNWILVVLSDIVILLPYSVVEYFSLKKLFG